MDTWDSAIKRLEKLKGMVPEPLMIELTYNDDTKEILSLDEVVRRDRNEWRLFRVVRGNDKVEVSQFLEWMCPECIID